MPNKTQLLTTTLTLTVLLTACTAENTQTIQITPTETTPPTTTTTPATPATDTPVTPPTEPTNTNTPTIDETLGGIPTGFSPWRYGNGLIPAATNFTNQIGECLNQNGYGWMQIHQTVQPPTWTEMQQNEPEIVQKYGFFINWAGSTTKEQKTMNLTETELAEFHTATREQLNECRKQAEETPTGTETVAATRLYSTTYQQMNTDPTLASLHNQFAACLNQNPQLQAFNNKPTYNPTLSPLQHANDLRHMLVETHKVLLRSVGTTQQHQKIWAQLQLAFTSTFPNEFQNQPKTLEDAIQLITKIEKQLAQNFWDCYQPHQNNYIQTEKAWTQTNLTEDQTKKLVNFKNKVLTPKRNKTS